MGSSTIEAEREASLRASEENASAEWAATESERHDNDFARPGEEEGTILHNQIMEKDKITQKEPDVSGRGETSVEEAKLAEEDIEVIDKEIAEVSAALDKALVAEESQQHTPVSDGKLSRSERRASRELAKTAVVSPSSVHGADQSPAASSRPPGVSNIGGAAASG